MSNVAGSSKKLDLLPCPFCGGEAEYEEVKDSGGTIWWVVGCRLRSSEHDEDDSCCGYQSLKTYARKGEAAAAWNKRHAHEPETAPVAWRKAVEPQYDYTDRCRYREEHGIGAPEGWEPLYAAPRTSQPPEALRYDTSAIYNAIARVLEDEAMSDECLADDIHAAVTRVLNPSLPPASRPTKSADSP